MKRGIIHVAFPMINPANGELGSFYLRSEDGGNSWSIPQLLNPVDTDVVALISDEEDHLHTLFTGRAGIGGRYYRWSADGGETWSNPITITTPQEGSGLSGGDLAVDSANTLHATFGLQGSEEAIVVHSQWDGTEWANWQDLSVGVPGHMERMSIEVTHGNRLHVVWESDWKSIWYAQGQSTAPELPAVPLVEVEQQTAQNFKPVQMLRHPNCCHGTHKNPDKSLIQLHRTTALNVVPMRSLIWPVGSRALFPGFIYLLADEKEGSEIDLMMSKLWTRRELLGYWTRREVSIRYKQSFLGITWAVFQPLALALVFSIVFSFIVHVPTEGIPYPLFAYTALVPWTFFANSLNAGVPSIVNQMNLVTKTDFPREILPFGTLGATFVDFLSAFVVFILLMVIYQEPFSLQVFWLPILVIIQMILSAGLLLWGSSLNVFFRDIRFIIPLITQLWMYATPIIYPVTAIPEAMRPIYFLNPMVGIIESYRNIFLRELPPLWPAMTVGVIVSVALFLSGYLFFRRVEPNFADII